MNLSNPCLNCLLLFQTGRDLVQLPGISIGAKNIKFVLMVALQEQS